MRKLFTSLSIMVCAAFMCTASYGQGFGQNTIDIGGNDYFNVIRPDGNMGLYLGGTTIKAGNNSDAAFVHLTFPMPFAYSYGTTGTETGNYLTTLIDGNILIAGKINTTSTNLDDDILLIKINPLTGSVIWSKVIGTDSNEVAIKAINSLDSNILVTGYTGNNTTDMFLMKVASSNGKVIFAKKIGLPQSNEVAYEVQELRDFIVPGIEVIALMGYSDLGIHGAKDISISVLDTDGNMFMQMFYGGTGDDEGQKGILTKAGYIYVAGNTSGYGAGGKDFFVMKLFAGAGLPTVNWFKTYGESGNDLLNSFEMNKKGLLLAGSTQSYGTGGDALLIQIDTNGNVLWAKNKGSAGNDVINGMIADTLSGVILTIGNTNSFGVGSTNDGYFIISDTAGNSGKCYGIPSITGQLHTINDSIEMPAIGFVSDTFNIDSLVMSITAVNLIPVFDTVCDSIDGIAQFEKDNFAVYPNPFNDKITITTDFTDTYNIRIFDITGRLIYTAKCTEPQTEIILPETPTGMYTLVCSDGKTIKRTKIIRE